MFQLWALKTSLECASHIKEYNTVEDAVKELLELWHEDDSERLFTVVGLNGHVEATIMRGINPDDATVCKNDGAAQRFRCVYTTTSGKTSCKVTSLD